MDHPAWESPIGERGRARGRDALMRIAGTLGVPIETLLDEARSERFPDETAELVRLWFRIRNPEARRAILEQVRVAAGGVR